MENLFYEPMTAKAGPIQLPLTRLGRQIPKLRPWLIDDVSQMDAKGPSVSNSAQPKIPNEPRFSSSRDRRQDSLGTPSVSQALDLGATPRAQRAQKLSTSLRKILLRIVPSDVLATFQARGQKFAKTRKTKPVCEIMVVSGNRKRKRAIEELYTLPIKRDAIKFILDGN